MVLSIKLLSDIITKIQEKFSGVACVNRLCDKSKSETRVRNKKSKKCYNYCSDPENTFAEQIKNTDYFEEIISNSAKTMFIFPTKETAVSKTMFSR